MSRAASRPADDLRSRPKAQDVFSIVADDLTGATDALAALGRPGVVTLDLAGFAAEDAAVAALDLDVRETPDRVAEDAYLRAFAIAANRTAQAAAMPVCKIDSRLRGPVEAALAALCAGVVERPVLLCPALPEEKRSFVGGRLFEGSAATVDLGTRLTARGLGPRCVPLSTVRDHRALMREIGMAPPRACLMIDAETRSDLDALAGGLARVPTPPALACSSGLLRSLSPEVGHAPRLPCLAPGAVVWIIGSPIAIREAASMNLEQVRADADCTLSKQAQTHLADAIGRGVPVLIGLPEPAAGQTLDPAMVIRLLGSLPPEVMTASAIVASGGATARAAMRALRMNRLDVCGEILPGAPLSHASGPGGQTTLVLRSGGFGITAPLLEISDRLRDITAKTDPDG